MSMTRIKSVLAGTVAGAALLGVAGFAQAATYAGSWDPEFGIPFANLAWTANAVWDVPSDCLALGGGSFTGNATSCSPITFSSLTVSFYSISSPGAAYNFLESFSLLSGGPLPTQFVTMIDTSGGQLVSFSSDLSPFFVPTAASWTYAGGQTGGLANYKFYLGFNIGPEGESLADLYYVTPTGLSNTCLLHPTASCNIDGESSVGKIGPVTVVPEPSTYALIVAGLALVGFVAKRRRA